MNEICFCGRIGEIEDRVPFTDGVGVRGLRCPNTACSHREYLHWLPVEARQSILDDVEERRSTRLGRRASSPTAI